MSPEAIVGLVWLGFGLLTIAIAVDKKVNAWGWVVPLSLFGPIGVFLVLSLAGAKARAGAYSADGSIYYGAAAYGGGLFGGFDGGHGGHSGHSGHCGFDGGHGGHGGFC
ncbi:MAG: hypothetical protein ACLPXZ_30855 [Mycobacterium sp.]